MFTYVHRPVTISEKVTCIEMPALRLYRKGLQICRVSQTCTITTGPQYRVRGFMQAYCYMRQLSEPSRLTDWTFYFYGGPGKGRGRQGEKAEGRGLALALLRALSVHLFVTLAVECCQCHMASQGRLNWLRADSVTGVSGRNCPWDVLITTDTRFVPRGKQTYAKVREGRETVG